MNRNFKKVLSMVMVLMMVVSTMMIVPLTTHAEEEPFAGVAINGITGMGTEAAPYLAATKADLDAIAVVANAADNAETGVVGFRGRKCYLNLTADVNIGGSSWGLNKNSYPSATNDGGVMWQIDGQGHTISNTNTQILYGTAGGVVIRNLNVVMSQTNGEAYGGALIGAASGYLGDTLIENCTVSGTMNYSRGGTRAAGGFIGSVIDTNANTVTIRNCANTAKIYASAADQPMGGFVGSMNAANATLVIENCINTGDIDAKGGYVGGIVGKGEKGTVVVDNCINTGEIKTTGRWAGGIIGFGNPDANVKNTVKNSFNTGKVISAIGTATGAAPTVNNTKTLDEVRATITMPRTDGATSEAWDGTVSETAPALQNPGAENSAENPYLVGTAAELSYFNKNAGFIKLTKNIDLGNKAWPGMKLGSTIDGDNYTIKNAMCQQYSGGFFTAGNGNITLKNLHFSHLTASGGSNAGGIVGYLSGGTLTLSNVTIDANSMIATNRVNGHKTAAIAGGLEGSAKLIADKCIIAAVVGGTGTHAGTAEKGIGVGGFVGINTLADASSVAITNSIMEGSISYNEYQLNSQNFCLGTIFGYAATAHTLENVFVLDGLTSGSCVKGQTSILMTLSGNTSPSFTAANATIAAKVPHLYTDACDTACDVPYCATTRVAPHVYTDDCDADCNAEGCDVTRTPTHYLDGTCDPMCDKCGWESGLAHQYTDDCDASCNVDGCGFVDPQRGHDWEFACTLDCSRCGEDNPAVVPHDYESNCDSACIYCGEDLRTAPHTWAGDCDTQCEDCDHTREGSGEHTYYGTCDTTCNVCGFVRAAGEHVYDNECDATCNVTDCGFERTAPHVWASDCDTVCEECDATREGDGNHAYTDECDAECNSCGFERVAPHVFSSACDLVCDNECGFERSADNAHAWADECDTECDECHATRVAPHVWSSECDTTCNNECGETRTGSGEHTWANVCDTECDACGLTRTVDHVWTSACDELCDTDGCGATRTGDGNHAYYGACDTTCNTCGGTRAAAGEHTYTNECDAACDVTDCTGTRVAPHKYSGDCDIACDNDGCTHTRAVMDAHTFAGACDTDCNVCGAVRAAGEHTYTNECDAKCDVDGCTAEDRVAPHKFSSDCDGACDNAGCTHTRVTTAAHAYDNACDTACNACGATRAAEHVYTNACDGTCNTEGCTGVRAPSAHVYDDDKDATCNVCGAERQIEAENVTPAPETTTKAPETTTAAPETTTAPEEEAPKKGCKGAMDSTYAVLALVAVLGFAFVAKKREEN